MQVTNTPKSSICFNRQGLLDYTQSFGNLKLWINVKKDARKTLSNFNAESYRWVKSHITITVTGFFHIQLDMIWLFSKIHLSSILEVQGNYSPFYSCLFIKGNGVWSIIGWAPLSKSWPLNPMWILLQFKVTNQLTRYIFSECCSWVAIFSLKCKKSWSWPKWKSVVVVFFQNNCHPSCLYTIHVQLAFQSVSTAI